VGGSSGIDLVQMTGDCVVTLNASSGRLHLLSPSLFLVKSERSSGVGGKILQKKSEGWEVASPCSQTLPPPSYLVTAPAVATTTDHDFRSASTWPGTFVDLCACFSPLNLVAHH